MNKKNVIMLALWIPLLYNICFFGIIRNFTTNIWLGYIFVHVTYVLLLWECYRSGKANGDLIYGYPRITMASILFLFTITYSVVFATLSIQSIIFFIIPYLILITGGVATGVLFGLQEDHLRKVQEKNSTDYSFIRNCSTSLKTFMSTEEDLIIRKKLETVYDRIRSAQVATCPEVSELEKAILGKIEAITSTTHEQIAVVIRELHSDIQKRDDIIHCKNRR